MKCNLLHINIKKCCYMHFTSNRKEVTADDDMLNLVLGQNVIKCVKETKFLGVIIDNKLSWDAHIKYLNSKLKCEIGKLNRMKHVIPNELYKNLYLTLFESHLSYGITAWGGVSKNLLKSLFTTQKKCIRIMFGDQDAYMAKFETCARTRTFESRILGREFFQREPSKPLFCNNSLLTVHNLYKYHCIVEMFKVVKLRIPISIYELMKRSRRRDNYFISLHPSSLFDYQASNFWNKCRKPSMYVCMYVCRQRAALGPLWCPQPTFRFEGHIGDIHVQWTTQAGELYTGHARNNTAPTGNRPREHIESRFYRIWSAGPVKVMMRANLRA